MHNWHNGYRNSFSPASWHRLEKVLETDMLTADDVARVALEKCIFPAKMHTETAFIADGTKVEGMKANVAEYRDGSRKVLGIGPDWTPVTLDNLKGIFDVIVTAGGVPDMVFSLAGGNQILATFTVETVDGIRTNVTVLDSLDGSKATKVLITVVRVVCANTLYVAEMERNSLSSRHTKNTNARVSSWQKVVKEALETGAKVREVYAKAKQTKVTRDELDALMEDFFPIPEDASKALETRRTNERATVFKAANLPENRDGKGTLATLFNGLTWAATRKFDRNNEVVERSGNLELFGTKAKRINSYLKKVEEMVTVIRPDGTEESVPVTSELGRDAMRTLGASMLDDMLS